MCGIKNRRVSTRRVPPLQGGCLRGDGNTRGVAPGWRVIAPLARQNAFRLTEGGQTHAPMQRPFPNTEGVPPVSPGQRPGFITGPDHAAQIKHHAHTVGGQTRHPNQRRIQNTDGVQCLHTRGVAPGWRVIAPSALQNAFRLTEGVQIHAPAQYPSPNTEGVPPVSPGQRPGSIAPRKNNAPTGHNTTRPMAANVAGILGV
jgi:hypothetical protein